MYVSFWEKTASKEQTICPEVIKTSIYIMFIVFPGILVVGPFSDF